MAPQYLLVAAMAACIGSAMATPAPIVARDGPDSSKCSMSSDNPGAMYDQINVNGWLQVLLEDNNGTQNWIQYMDTHYNKGVGNLSLLDCQNFPDSTQCGFPTANCQDFTPPEQYYVRVSVATFYEIMNKLYNGVTDWIAVAAALEENQNVFNDFKPPSSKVDISGIFSGALEIASAAMEAFGPFGAIFSGIAGVLEVTQAATQDPEANIDPTQSLKDSLTQIWLKEKDTMTTNVQSVLGNGKNQGLVEQTFAHGAFIMPGIKNDDQVQQFVDLALNATEQSILQKLAVTTIKANNYFVWVDTKTDQDYCNGITGTRWMNGHCYMLGSKGDPYNKPVQPMDHDMVLHLDSHDRQYRFDVNEFYQNAQNCTDSGGDQGGTSLPNPLYTKTLPKCFVNLPVFTAEDTPCNDKDHDVASLGFDDNFCNPPPIGGTFGGE